MALVERGDDGAEGSGGGLHPSQGQLHGPDGPWPPSSMQSWHVLPGVETAMRHEPVPPCARGQQQA